MTTRITFLTVLTVLIFSSCEKEKTPTDVIDFEKFELGEAGYWNGSDETGGFTLGNAVFGNSFNADWQSWSGFSVSNHTDVETPGYGNQYSCIAGSGANGSEKYAVLYSFSKDTIHFNVPEKITNISICNSTYAYLSMLNGDDFSSKYGGESGDEPDFLILTVDAHNEAGANVGSFTVNLADFRPSDAALRYIGNAWTDIDMSIFGYVKYLVFSFDSSRKNDFGILTPTYVCIDNIEGELME